MTTPWIMKYRLNDIDSLFIDETNKSALKEKIANKDIENMILTGPCGTGKTTCARSIGYGILGDKMKRWFLELNASDDRGIAVVRDKIDNFSAMRALSVPLKIVFLDEADSMTSQAQETLCQTMEKYRDTTRFILSCNHYQRMIEFIRSRCSMIVFDKVNEKFLYEKIQQVIQYEGLSCDDDVCNAIIQYSDGDVRRALSILQTLSIVSPSIKKENVDILCDEPEYRYVDTIIDAVAIGDFQKARTELYTLYHRGTTLYDIIELLIQSASKKNTNITYKIFIRRFQIHSILQVEGLLADICIDN